MIGALNGVVVQPVIALKGDIEVARLISVGGLLFVFGVWYICKQFCVGSVMMAHVKG